MRWPRNKLPRTPRARLLRAVLYIVFAAWVCAAYAGWALVSDRAQASHAHLKGWVALAVCALAALPTADRWANYLYVPFGGLSLGLLTALLRGQYLGAGAPPLSRAVAAGLLALSLACGGMGYSLAGRKLSGVGRTAVLGLLVAFPVGIFEGSLRVFAASLAACLACMAVARLTSAAGRPSRRGTRTKAGRGRGPVAEAELDREP